MTINNWNQSILDVGELVKEVKRKTTCLRQTVKTFEELRVGDEPFSSENASQPQ